MATFMSNPSTSAVSEERRQMERRESWIEGEASAKKAATGSSAEGLCAAGGVVLAILGLVGIFPALFAAIATLAVGVAMMFQGAALAARYGKYLTSVSGDRTTAVQLGGGVTLEFLAGTGGIVLGILALLGIAPVTLIAVAAICLGGGILFGGGSTAKAGTLSLRKPHVSARAWEVANEAVMAGGAVQSLAGAGAVVLGILALVGIAPTTLNLVSMLSLGAAGIVGASAFGAKMVALFAR